MNGNGKVTLAVIGQMLKDVSKKVDSIDTKMSEINDRTVDQEARLKEAEKKIEKGEDCLDKIRQDTNKLHLTVAKNSGIVSLVIAVITSACIWVVTKFIGD